MRTAFFAATIAAIGFQQAQALYDQVYTLTDQNFDDYVTNDHENVWVVNYYADWCPHAQSFESDYHRAAEHAKASGYKVKYGAMDAASNYATAQRYGVQRSPSVHVYGQDKAHPTEYEGARSYDAVTHYVDNYCEEHSYTATTAETTTYETNEAECVEGCDEPAYGEAECVENCEEEHVEDCEAECEDDCEEETPAYPAEKKVYDLKKLKRAVDAAHRKEQERLYHAKVAAQRQSYADFSTEKRELYVAADQAIEEILNGRDEAVYNLTNENKADLKAIHDDYVLQAQEQEEKHKQLVRDLKTEQNNYNLQNYWAELDHAYIQDIDLEYFFQYEIQYQNHDYTSPKPVYNQRYNPGYPQYYGNRPSNQYYAGHSYNSYPARAYSQPSAGYPSHNQSYSSSPSYYSTGSYGGSY